MSKFRSGNFNCNKIESEVENTFKKVRISSNLRMSVVCMCAWTGLLFENNVNLMENDFIFILIYANKIFRNFWIKVRKYIFVMSRGYEVFICDIILLFTVRRH